VLHPGGDPMTKGWERPAMPRCETGRQLAAGSRMYDGCETFGGGGLRAPSDAARVGVSGKENRWVQSRSPARRLASPSARVDPHRELGAVLALRSGALLVDVGSRLRRGLTGPCRELAQKYRH